MLCTYLPKVSVKSLRNETCDVMTCDEDPSCLVTTVQAGGGVIV